jgi:uncharacterized protein YdcH (DUF465 family)
VLEVQRLKEQSRKADAAIEQLRQQIADLKEELAAHKRDVAAAQAEKDAALARAVEQHNELVGAQVELSKQRNANEEVR